MVYYPLMVGPGYYLDFIAILEVKIYYCEDESTKAKLKESYESHVNTLKSNLPNGGDLNEIMRSNTYRNLVMCNADIFNLIDKIEEGGQHIDAEVVHELNCQRHKLKGEIEKKFFGQKNAEIKLLKGDKVNE